MPKFRVVTPKGASFTVAGGGYDYEKEALDPIDAEIVEAPANEAEFIAAARTADAIYAKGMPITKAVIDALENCKVITLGTVGVDSVDVKAATARGIPVTNVPDTFIEEVADHAMMLLLAGFRRLVAQDRMVPRAQRRGELVEERVGAFCRDVHHHEVAAGPQHAVRLAECRGEVVDVAGGAVEHHGVVGSVRAGELLGGAGDDRHAALAGDRRHRLGRLDPFADVDTVVPPQQVLDQAAAAADA